MFSQQIEKSNKCTRCNNRTDKEHAWCDNCRLKDKIKRKHKKERREAMAMFGIRKDKDNG